MFNQYDKNDLTDIETSEADIIKAIDQLNENSSPAKLMMLLTRQSLDENSVADIHRTAYASPSHLRSSKLLQK